MGQMTRLFLDKSEQFKCVPVALLPMGQYAYLGP